MGDSVKSPIQFFDTMKTSKYNIFFEHNNAMLGYNTLYETGISINKEVFPVLLNEIQTNLDSFATKYHKVYDTLIKERFIIEDHIDEVSVIKDILEETNNNESEFDVTINPTTNCNFRCWYCYETHMKGTKMSTDVVNQTINFIKKIIDNKHSLKHLNIRWFGGEPLMYFKDTVQPILSEIKKYTTHRNIQLTSGFTTNGYFINDEILEFCKNHSVHHFQITIDGHKERHNLVRFTKVGVNTYDKIISNILLCIKKGISVSVRINISAESYVKTDNILNSFKGLTSNEKSLLRFSIHKVWQEDEWVTTNVEAVVEKIRSRGFNCLSFYSAPNTIRRSCYADKKNYVTINYNGEIFKCTARDFISQNSVGKLTNGGEIEWNENYEKREQANALNSENCLKCSILPLCNAGCSQKKIENPLEYCLYEHDEQAKKEFAKKVLLEKLYFSNKKVK